MSAADLIIGFFGKIPATGDFVAWNLPRTFIDRWDRWMSMELRARPDEGELDSRAWRFVIQEGIFSDQPCAGAWRMSEDRVGRRYPFAVIRLGPPPDPGDPWFDAVVASLQGCVADHWSQGRLTEHLEELPAPSPGAGSSRIVFWSDDWEVKEFSFSDIHDLAANALPGMRAAPAQTVEF
ncbi:MULTISPECIES: type VI secretion system-associated protein TagF [unclassified Mesorhizobium]|uniref:type VI secretion system-associated protein TagF n=1 Tax=unclassified Mesorhizobium TaxID=325217 RepID=UPI00115408F7|nr:MULTISPECIES: type VI secretion system-associated protein TagF [unclassified Mesorhizobium]MBZ9683628.1 type VI secretion system-associated protein TagF [Mesorhizobium sp. CO1-1-2]MBZ9696508.1 type VI secretion system-associated protein TagF [Mesorhizobium sp. CO1-1-9]MBZ9725500.1 type VI secretion system-associated protein TagF [Mesorhizobium sp. CO1-1-11]MBZ9923565.1 type VI secretion system-associated protein TagF [Mesorhizobium sp. BR1-1-4]TPK80152.1 type VI secretion system-associated 